MKLGQRHILYDAALIEHPDEALFSPELQETGMKTAEGRGEAIFYDYHGLNLVLKHYHRGGLVARVSNDRYLRRRLDFTRSFKEWELLRLLQNLNLPAPVPVAASVIKSSLFYQADLVTREITNVMPLADLLYKNALEPERWQDIGSCIRRFHDHDIYHADLNARNILVGDNDVYLIDFDKGAVRYLGDSWKSSNLTRLKRSLLKFEAKSEQFHFTEDDWRSLLAGYGSVK
jgi:tRNA A-37 threonylcarbamoyl transferase component Bud32